MRQVGWGLLTVAGAGAAGGLLNAVVGPGGVNMPVTIVVEGKTVWVPGILGTVLVGAAAATLSYALYGPASALPLIGGEPIANASASDPRAVVTLGAMAGALLVGFTGGRWIATEAESQLRQGTAVLVARIAKTPGPRRAADLSAALETISQRSALEGYQAVSKLEP